MLNFLFWQTFYFTLKCNIAVQNIVKKAYMLGGNLRYILYGDVSVMC